MRKFLKIIGVLAAIFIIYVICAFYGNPISKYLVTHNAEEYLDENYQNTDFEIGTVNYDFKTGSYYVHVISPTSEDSSFTIFAGLNGKIGYDSYEDAVVEKWNTATRINGEYWEVVKSIIESEEFPYNQHIGFGDIEFASSDMLSDESTPDYAIKSESLELDRDYNISEFGAKAGHLTVYIYDETVTAERLGEILIGIRELFDTAGVNFYVIDCVLEYPRVEGEEPKDDRVEVMGFLYEDINEDGITARVKSSDEKAKAYYEAQNAEKLQQK